MKLHPVSLLLLVLWLSSTALFVPHLGWLSSVALLSFLCQGILHGFAWRELAAQARYMLPLCAMVLLIQALFVKEGILLMGQGWYSVHALAVERGLAFCLRLSILWFCAGILVQLSYEDFDLAFGTLRLPEELSFMTFHAVHIIPEMTGKFGHYRQLLTLRGIEAKKLALRQKVEIYKLISISILAGVIYQSSLQAIALELRGFRSSGKRSRLHTRVFGWQDAALALMLLLLSIIYLA